jgi:hypothetical protein
MAARAMEIAFGDRCTSDALSAATRATEFRDYMDGLPDGMRLTESEETAARRMCDLRRCAVAIRGMIEQSGSHSDECGIYETWGRVLGIIRWAETSGDDVESAERKCVSAANRFLDEHGIDALSACLGCRESAAAIVRAEFACSIRPPRVMHRTPPPEASRDDAEDLDDSLEIQYRMMESLATALSPRKRPK